MCHIIDEVILYFRQFLLSKDNVDGKDKKGLAPIHHAINHGHFDIVKELIYHGADVNAKNYFNSSALKFAVRSGDVNIVKLLVEHGADVNQKDVLGFSCLDVGKENKRYAEICKVVGSIEK